MQDIFERRVPGYGLNRDPERSPMRWDDSRNGGFTTGKPWLPMGNDVAERNIARQQQDPHSLIWLYRSLIALRSKEPALTAGAYRPLRSLDDVLMFKRCHGDTELQIALNFSHDPRRVQAERDATLLISTHLDRVGTTITAPFILRGDEGVVLKARIRTA